MTMLAPEIRFELLALAIVLLLVAVFVLRRLVRRRMADRAMRDPETGTYTAGFIQEVYEAELRRAERTGVPFSVALVALRDDVGSGKPLPSDAPLAAAQWLRESLRGSDYIGGLMSIALRSCSPRHGKRMRGLSWPASTDHFTTRRNQMGVRSTGSRAALASPRGPLRIRTYGPAQQSS